MDTSPMRTENLPDGSTRFYADGHITGLIDTSMSAKVLLTVSGYDRYARTSNAMLEVVTLTLTPSETTQLAHLLIAYAEYADMHTQEQS